MNLSANPISLAYSVDGVNFDTIATGEANDGSYAWTVPLLSTDAVTVRITAEDVAGNTSSDMSDASFTLDSDSPTVSITFPANHTIM